MKRFLRFAEMSIIEARKKYREALKALKELRAKYLEEKGAYYLDLMSKKS